MESTQQKVSHYHEKNISILSSVRKSSKTQWFPIMAVHQSIMARQLKNEDFPDPTPDLVCVLQELGFGLCIFLQELQGQEVFCGVEYHFGHFSSDTFFLALQCFEHWLLVFAEYVSFQVINPGHCVALYSIPSFVFLPLFSPPSPPSHAEFLDSCVDSVLDSLVLRPFLFIFVIKQI